MAERMAAIIDVGSPAKGDMHPQVPVVTAVARSHSGDSDTGADADEAVAAVTAAGDNGGADVHIDHVALAASIQMQAEGLFRMPEKKWKQLDTLQV